jgi:hypothetical protein
MFLFIVYGRGALCAAAYPGPNQYAYVKVGTAYALYTYDGLRNIPANPFLNGGTVAPFAL